VYDLRALDRRGEANMTLPDTADAADPNEISFHKGEVLEIAHKRGRWWLARKADGTTGGASILLD
jgi:hypothetical protein